MGLIELIIILVVVGLVIWALSVHVAPRLPAPWGGIAIALVVLVICLMLLAKVGLLPAGLLR